MDADPYLHCNYTSLTVSDKVHVYCLQCLLTFSCKRNIIPFIYLDILDIRGESAEAALKNELKKRNWFYS